MLVENHQSLIFTRSLPPGLRLHVEEKKKNCNARCFYVSKQHGKQFLPSSPQPFWSFSIQSKNSFRAVHQTSSQHQAAGLLIKQTEQFIAAYCGEMAHRLR
jgi:hypothetical protein